MQKWITSTTYLMLAVIASAYAVDFLIIRGGHFCSTDWRTGNKTKNVERESMIEDRKKSA